MTDGLSRFAQTDEPDLMIAQGSLPEACEAVDMRKGEPRLSIHVDPQNDERPYPW